MSRPDLSLAPPAQSRFWLRLRCAASFRLDAGSGVWVRFRFSNMGARASSDVRAFSLISAQARRPVDQRSKQAIGDVGCRPHRPQAVGLRTILQELCRWWDDQARTRGHPTQENNGPAEKGLTMRTGLTLGVCCTGNRTARTRAERCCYRDPEGWLDHRTAAVRTSGIRGGVAIG